MPDSCSAVGCSNRRGKTKVPFYRIPSGKSAIEKRRRAEWIKAIKRADWKHWADEKISRAKICGNHFISGKRSEDPTDTDWIPTVFSFSGEQSRLNQFSKLERRKRFHVLQAKRKQKCELAIEEINENIVQIDPAESSPEPATYSSVSKEEKLSKELLAARQKIAKMEAEIRGRCSVIYKMRLERKEIERKSTCFCFKSIEHYNEHVKFFTGLSSVEVFNWIVSRVKGSVKICHSRLTVEDHVLIVLMKLRLGLLNKDLAFRFGVLPTTVSGVYRKWLPALSRKLQQLIIWPDRSSIRRNLPQSFQKKFRDAVCIIDCSEIFIQRAKNLTARAQTWSNYKHNNTIKYLLGISPAGAVTFLSAGWGGRVSDKQITMESGFLNKVAPGDCILADRGFLIKEELAERGAVLKIPSFTKGKKQLPAKEVDESRSLSRVRIHVERVIGRLKDYRMLNTVIPLSQVDLLDHATIVISACINLNRSVVPQKRLK